MILNTGVILIILNLSNGEARDNAILWCQSLYQPSNRRLRNIYRGIFNTARSYSLFITKSLIVSFGVVFIITHFGILIVGNLVLHEKYALPGNFFIPFIPPHNIYLFLINEIHQFFAFGTLCVHTLASIVLFFVVMSHYLVNLDAIQRLIENMSAFVGTGEFMDWVRLVAIEIEAVKV